MKESFRALGWTLLLVGWVGIGCLAQALTAGPMAAFAVIACWLLALAMTANGLNARSTRPSTHRALSLAAGLMAASAFTASVHGGGALFLLPAILALATMVALARNLVGSAADAELAGQPAGPAAIGALLAWACLGDIGDPRTLATHMAMLAIVASMVLAAFAPARTGGWRHRRAESAGGSRPDGSIPDCSLPAWTLAEWRAPHRWPLQLSALAMLPMMAGLPWMLGLCRSDGVSAQAMLGCHLAAMFLPAGWMARHRGLLPHAPALCAVLLALGALALLAGPRASAWWLLAISHGAAWGVAWAARSAVAADASTATPAPWQRAAINALCCFALGAAVATQGLEALAACHIALGAAAAASVAVALLRRLFRDVSPRRLYDPIPIDTH